MPARTTRLYLASFAMDAAFNWGWAAVPFLVRGERELYLDDAGLGALIAASSVLYVLGTWLLPALWLRRNHARLARVAAVGTGAGFVLAALAAAPWQLFLWLALGKLALSAFWPNLMALVGESAESGLVKRIGSFNVAWSLGKTVAFLACGFVLAAFGEPRLALASCGVLCLLTALAVPPPPHGAVVAMRSAAVESGRELLFRVGLLGIFAAWFVCAIWQNQFPEGLGRERFGQAFGDGYELGANVLLFCLFSGQLVAFVLLRLWTGWPLHGWTLGLAALLLAVSQVAALLAQAAALLGALLFVSGLASGVFYAQSLYHAQAGSGVKVRRCGYHEAMLNLGYVIGPPLAGQAAVLSGRRDVPFVITAIAGGTCLLATGWLLVRGIPRSAPAQM